MSGAQTPLPLLEGPKSIHMQQSLRLAATMAFHLGDGKIEIVQREHTMRASWHLALADSDQILQGSICCKWPQ